jgi:hypothetical protein
MQQLSDTSVLMRFSAGLPGMGRKDKAVTAEVTADKAIEEGTGEWRKKLWPKDALKAVKTKQGEARAYHDKVTLPFGSRGDDDASDTGEQKPDAIAGIGLLPAVLIKEYGDNMRRYVGEMEKLVEDVITRGPELIAWAFKAHNGTFEPENYPGCSLDSNGQPVLDMAVWSAKMRRKFYLRTEPLPVPNASHFADTVTQLLGVDAYSVNVRVRDAGDEARKEVMRRLLEPVAAMAKKLAEQPKAGKDGKVKEDIVFRDTLVGNIREICELAPKLNVTGDPEIDKAVAEVEALTRYTPNALRDDKSLRSEAQRKAEETLARLSGYRL